RERRGLRGRPKRDIPVLHQSEVAGRSHREHVPGRKLAEPTVERRRTGGITVEEECREGSRVDLRGQLRVPEERFDLRGKREEPRGGRVVERFLAGPVAPEDEPAPAGIPEGERDDGIERGACRG